MTAFFQLFRDVAAMLLMLFAPARFPRFSSAWCWAVAFLCVCYPFALVGSGLARLVVLGWRALVAAVKRLISRKAGA